MRASLLDNPFAVLKVAASATNEDIVDAHDDLGGERDVDEARLAEARQALLSPRTRLTAELAFLMDTSEAEADRLLGQLAPRAARDGLIAATERLSPLSRTNLLVALIETFGLTDDLLVKLVSAQAEIAVGDVVAALRRVRTKAGVVMPNEESVAQALDGLFEQQARAALQTASDPAGLAATVTAVTVAICATNNADRFERLDAVQQSYWRIVSRETAVLRSDLDAIGKRLLDGGGDGDLDAYIAALRRWDVFGQPLQVLERARGREDREAQAVQASVRGLCLDLANEKKRSEAALRITKAAREVFAELDRTAATLAEDVDVLTENAAVEASRPLETILDRLRRSPDAFVREIEAGRTGAGTEWAALFGTLSDTLSKTKWQDAPWILLRSFGIDLFNTSRAEGAALTFVAAVLERARQASASLDIVKRLEADIADLDSILAQKRLGQAVEAKRWHEALTHAKGLATSARTLDERQQAASLIASIRRAQNRQTWTYVKWGSFAVVGLVLIVNAVNENGGRSSSQYGAPTTQNLPHPVSRPSFPPPQPSTLVPAPPTRTPTLPADPAAEAKPARLTPGSFEQPRFSIGNIRYCLFENERLERLRARGSSTDDVLVDRFNEAVADWNAHCSRYRYLPSEMDAVRTEVQARADELLRQALARAEQWGRTWRAAAPSRPAPAPSFPPPSVPPPLPQASTTSAASSLPIDLLNQDLARRVQVRLADLGYFKGPASGTWGPASRAAMRAFNLAHFLGDTDMATSAVMGVLFGASPVRAGSPTDRLPSGYAEARYPPPQGAMLNPLNGTDAVEVHRMLRDLGFYQGRNETLWSGASRVALRDFKTRNGLPTDDTWNVATEAALKAQVNDPWRASEREFQARIVGHWTTDVRSCSRREPGLPLPITISSDRAAVAGQGCEFIEKSGAGNEWMVRAVCRVDGGSWNTNIRLSRSGDSLTWTSERGTTIYRRCDT
jgi:hypothetical protein